MDVESVGSQECDSVNGNERKNSLFLAASSRKKRRSRKPGKKSHVLHRPSSRGEMSWPRPPRKSLRKGDRTVPGTDLLEEEASKVNNERRRSLSKPILELLERTQHSRKSLNPVQQVKAGLNGFVEAISGHMSSRSATAEKTEAYKVGFNFFQYTDDELVTHVHVMVNEFLNLDENKRGMFFNLTMAIKANYKSNPFHNFKHAFGVAHMAFMFMTRNASISHNLGKRKVLAFVIAALGHDLNHPGNDNSYEVDTASTRVAEYAHEAVLENYHAHLLLQLIKEEDKNVFYGITAKKELSVQQFIAEAVLGTDMKQHKSHVQLLSRISDFPEAMKSRNFRNTIMCAILHACDLSGQCADLEVAIDWEGRISEEFKNQAKLLQEAGRPVPTNLQTLEDVTHRAKLQLGFIDNCLEPLWEQIARCMPNMEAFYNNLTMVVRKYYETLYRDGEQAAHKFFLAVKDVPMFSVKEKGRYEVNHYPQKSSESTYYTTDEEDGEVER